MSSQDNNAIKMIAGCAIYLYVCLHVFIYHRFVCGYLRGPCFFLNSVVKCFESLKALHKFLSISILIRH